MAGDVKNIGPTDEIYEQTADWVTLLQSDNISAEEEVEFQIWLKQDTHHFTAFQRMQDMLERTDILNESITNIVQGSPSTFPGEKLAIPKSFASKRFEIAASVFCVALLSLFF